MCKQKYISFSWTLKRNASRQAGETTAEVEGAFTGDCCAEKCLECERDGGTAPDGPLVPEQTCSPIEDSDQTRRTLMLLTGPKTK